MNCSHDILMRQKNFNRSNYFAKNYWSRNYKNSTINLQNTTKNPQEEIGWWIDIKMWFMLACVLLLLHYLYVRKKMDKFAHLGIPHQPGVYPFGSWVNWQMIMGQVCMYVCMYVFIFPDYSKHNSTCHKINEQLTNQVCWVIFPTELIINLLYVLHCINLMTDSNFLPATCEIVRSISLLPSG